MSGYNDRGGNRDRGGFRDRGGYQDRGGRDHQPRDRSRSPGRDGGPRGDRFREPRKSTSLDLLLITDFKKKAEAEAEVVTKEIRRGMPHNQTFPSYQTTSLSPKALDRYLIQTSKSEALWEKK